MFQSYLSKLFKKKPAEDTLVPPLWGTREKNIRFSSIICARCCTRRNLRFHVENCQQADPKTAHATIGLRSRHRSNPRPTRFVSGKAGECRSWPRRYQVDPWSRGREVARGVLRSSPKPEKKPIFLPSETDREFLSPVFYAAATKYVCIRRLAGARHLSPVVL